MIKKGISFWSFPDGTTIAQGIKTSKTAGFEGIELLLVKDCGEQLKEMALKRLNE